MAYFPPESKTYVDTDVYVPSTCKSVDPFGVESIVIGFGGRVKSFRKGLRRPKPKYLDPTPYELIKIVSHPIRGTWSYKEGSFPPFQYSGSNNYDPSGDTASATRVDGGVGFDANVMAVSRLNAIRKLNFKDVDLGTALKESGKTVQLLADVAHLSVDLIRAARRRDARGFIQRLGGDADHHRLPAGQNVLDTYLAYHYGVKPALQDIAGATQALTRLPPEAWVIRTKGGYEYTKSRANKLAVGYNCAVTTAASLTQSCRTHITCQRKDITRQQDVLWALGLDDPLSTAWEVTPWSFVADWAFPVGDWLRAINTSKYYENWKVSSTQFLDEEVKYSPTTMKIKSNLLTSMFKGGGFTRRHIKRNVQDTLPITELPVKNPVSLDHMAKGLSLLATTLSRGGEIPRFIRY